MVDVLFLSAKAKSNLASSVVRAKQLSAMYAQMRPDLNVAYREARWGLPQVALGRTTIINKTYMTSFPASTLPRKTNRHRYILDPVDAKIREDYIPIVDGIVTTNLTSVSLNEQSYPGKEIFYVPLHANLQVPAHRAQQETFKAAYFGNFFNCRFLPEVSSACGVEAISTPTNRNVGSWAERLREFSAHVSFRENKDWDGTKPFTKGIFAALTGAIYIGDPVSEARYLLGEDYPYFVASSNVESAIAAVEKAKDTFGSSLWREAKNRMASVALESSVHKVLAQLNSMIINWR